jgi:hypothetical protein
LNALCDRGDTEANDGAGHSPWKAPNPWKAAAPLLRQWLAQILLGAVNIEQSKLLNTAHLSRLLGGRLYKDLGKQRQWLGDFATDDIIRSVLQINGRHLELTSQSDFYLDPHTKHYTGEKNVLKGWCSGIGHVDKVMHSDFIHNVDGHPVYFETTDNFYDLRERTFDFLERFRTTMEFEASKLLTVVIDRGIFGAETFAKFAEHPHLQLITWEKDYRHDGWNEDLQAKGEFIYERPRNHSRDLFTYHFSYQEHRWEKDSRLKRIIVRATNPRGKPIEVSILSDALDRDSKEIILLIFRRWVQENDFKYLDKHFGIDQITSYQAVSYKELAEEITDKQMLSTAHRALNKQRQEETSKLKNLLWKRDRTQRREGQRRASIAALENQLKSNEPNRPEKQTLRKQIGNHRGQQKRAEQNLEKWERGIEEQHKKLDQINQQLEETGAEESRLENLIDREAVKMKGSRKRLMDALKILARNLFYLMLAPFKSEYDNYRDDHVIFRSLTTSGGLIEADEFRVTCHLVLEPDYPRSIRELLENYLRDWNENSPEFPDGTGRPVTLKLTTAEGIQVAPPESPILANH